MIKFKSNETIIIGDWGLGICEWGRGYWRWRLGHRPNSQTPTPQPPIPNPHRKRFN